MSSYIKSYKLLNFQSWNKTGTEIPLETGMVNIIEGANETGKSVLYKVLYNFCFPGYWAPTELIRRGCQTGILLLQLDDGAAIIYALQASSYTYVLVEPNGERTEWTNQGCPDEIVERLGLILDKETRVVLNIIDSDVALPFIKTTPAFNASLIRAIVEPEGMTKFFQNLADTTIKIDNAYSYFNSKAATLQEQIVRIPIIDPVDMENQKADIDRLSSLAEKYNSIENKCNSLNTCHSEIITVVEDPSVISEQISLYDKLNACLVRCNELNAILSEEIQEVTSPAVVDESIAIQQALSGIIRNCSNLRNVYAQTPIVVSELNLDTELNRLDSLTSLITMVSKILELYSSTVPEVKFEDVSSDIELLEHIYNVIERTDSILTPLKSLAECEVKINTLQSEIKQIVNEVGVCPTCGQLLGGHDDSCIHNT